MLEVKQPDGQDQSAGIATTHPSRAKLSYPYFNMRSSMAVARAIHENGGGSCTSDQLADFLNYVSVKSGTFQTRTSAARQFGFLKSGGGVITITDRAQKILNPVMSEDSASAKADAFLAVDLFNMIYKKFQGITLPPDEGLKNLLVQEYGLSKDRASPAIRVFLESAEEAGFLKKNGNRLRLIKPFIMPFEQKQDRAQEQKSPNEEHQDPSKDGSFDAKPAEVHSAIMGLLRELPEPKTVWTKQKKDAFKVAFAATLDFIYPTDEQANEK